MQLTQSLMELFVEYQVPPDLLSYDGENEDASTKDKVENVKEHVQAVLKVIDENKKKQLEVQAMKADMAAELHYADHPIPAGSQTMMPNAKLPTLGVGGGKRFGGNSVRSGQMEFGGMIRNTEMAASIVCSSDAVKKQAMLFKKPSAKTSCTSNAHRFEELSGTVANLKSKSLNISDESGGQSEGGVDSMVSGEQGKDDLIAKGESGHDFDKALDFTAIPRFLDSAIEKYDKDNALRSTTIKTGEQWTRCRQENLLTKPQITLLSPEGIRTEKDKAYDLLDALSRSGSIAMQYSELHVIVCVTHRFEKSVMETVIVNNINPIEKLEMSTMILASTIHGVNAEKLICNSNDRERLATSFPTLLRLEAPKEETKKIGECD
jgi:hypothetical protein